MKIGIMQGRLVPPIDGRFQCFPRDRWEDEFRFAADAGLSSIEWIYDEFGEDCNPIATDKGLERMKDLSKQHGIQVNSICADYFMDKPFLRTSDREREERTSMLRWLLQRGQLLNINHIVLPFVDVSKIESESEFREVAAIVNLITPDAEKSGIELHLETSLDPKRFAALLDTIPSPMVLVTYDSGNSASLGFKVEDEFQAYGHRVGSVHVKDRILGGGTVSLGTGNADLPTLFKVLRKYDYQRDVILQVARAIDGDEVAWSRRNRLIVENLIRDAEYEVSQ